MERAVHDFAQKAQPQTLAHALADSPAGQLAWIVQLLAGLDPDVILTNASIYWFTNTAASAAASTTRTTLGAHARRTTCRSGWPASPWT